MLFDQTSKIKSAEKITLIAGLVLTAASFVFGLSNKAVLIEAHLIGALICVSLPLGSMFIAMVHALAHGRWGFVIRKAYLAGGGTFWLAAVLFLPVLMGMGHLYPWTDAEMVSHDHILSAKTWWLNIPFFQIRTVFYFAVWVLLAGYMKRVSEGLIHETDDESRAKLQLSAGLSLLGFVFTATFSSFDWSMSLMPHWFSTIYGIFTIIGQSLFALTFFIVTAFLFSSKTGIEDKSVLDRIHESGNLVLALVMLWMYMGFSQFFIIWSGNIPEEIIYYLPRSKNGWQCFAALLAAGHFFVPFFLLINRSLKRSVPLLALVCLWIFGMRFVDQIWTVLPGFRENLSDISWIHAVLPAGMFLLMAAAFMHKLGKEN